MLKNEYSVKFLLKFCLEYRLQDLRLLMFNLNKTNLRHLMKREKRRRRVTHIISHQRLAVIY